MLNSSYFYTMILKRKNYGAIGAIGKLMAKYPKTSVAVGGTALGITALGAAGVKNQVDAFTGKMGEANGGGY